MKSLDHIVGEARARTNAARTPIMTVDDEAGTVKAIMTMLEARGYAVSGAMRSEEALEVILGDSPPKFVLLDIHLADDDINGIDLLKKIKAGGFEGIVCIFSGDDSPERILEALLAGANDYIAKPVMDLAKEVKIIIENHDGVERGELLLLERTRFLSAKGLFSDQLDLLEKYRAAGYPDIPDFAEIMGISESALSDRMLRIRKRLNVDNNAQLASLLTALSGYGAHRRA